MGYHKKTIVKGTLGQFSKIREEYDELTDAIEQQDSVLAICELTDLIGAIGEYSYAKYNITIDDLVRFSNKTKEAFKEGKR